LVRSSDEVASWFGDKGATQRRRYDEQRQQHLRGRGPKGYRRSDERIKEDISDRLSDGYLDATDIEVAVANGEVTLTGNCFSRADKRRAEDLADSVSGVTNVENRLRVKPSVLGSPRDTLIGDQPSITQPENATSRPGSTTGTEIGRGKTAGS
jgi:osmotically-inducible protein OsmY